MEILSGTICYFLVTTFEMLKPQANLAKNILKHHNFDGTQIQHKQRLFYSE